MPPQQLSRRACLTLLGTGAAVSLLAACGGTSQLQASATSAVQKPAAGTTAAPGATTAAAPAVAATAIPSPTPGVRPIAMKSGYTPLRIWFHWGGKTGDFAQQLINDYNGTQGDQDKIHVTIETIPGGQYLEKMTAVNLAGDPPDVYHTSVVAKVLSKNQIAEPFPQDEAQYVKDNYIAGAVDRMTIGGKIWGYPTEHQAPAYIYRQSLFDEVGIKGPPTTPDDEYEYAVKLTKKDGGKTTRYGYSLYHDGYPISDHLPGLIARFGGQMYTFDGDRPTKIDVASQPAIDAVGWWKKLVDAGTTQVGQMPYADSWKNGLSSTTEIEVWFTLINVRDAGRKDIYDDLRGVALVPKAGVKPIAYAGGWELVAAKGSKHNEERWKFMKWMMHKPAMPFSHFIVERIGAIPSPTDYPAEVPGWSKPMIQAYAVDTAKITQAHPGIKVLGGNEINKAISDSLQGVLLGQQQLETALKELNPRLNDILKRTDPA